jgi:hypothetical protein
MKKALTAVVAAAAIAGTLAATATDASAQWRRGWGWGPGIAAGVIGGLALGAILATRPRGYVVYEGYGQPVYGPGCYWSAQPIYDRRGVVVGYTGQRGQVCPGYPPQYLWRGLTRPFSRTIKAARRAHPRRRALLVVRASVIDSPVYPPRKRGPIPTCPCR